MVFNWVPAVAAVLIAAVLMVLCGCLRNVEEAYRTINWESIVLIAAMLPMSVALEKTGASEAISQGLVAGLGGFGPFALMAGVYFTASLLTMFISNTATAVLLAPIALQSSASMGISPYPLLLAVSVGTSMCLPLPFHAAQCPGHAGGEIYVHGLRESGRSPAGDYGAGHGRGDSAVFPFGKA